MRKLLLALGLVAALQVGSVVADGRVLSVTLPTGTEITATLKTVDTAAATHGEFYRSGCASLRIRCSHRR